MRIDAYNQVAQLYQTNVQQKNKGAKTEKTSASSDALQLSRIGKDLQAAKQAVKAAPDIREDKVNALKERLASGTYNITGKDLAEKMVNSYFDSLI